MKKLFLLLVILLCTFGCQNARDMSIEETVKEFSSTIKNANTYRIGYKYNLPSKMYSDESDNFIEVINSELYTYYLYVDVVSYYNQIGNLYVENKSAFYSAKYEINEKISYLEVNIMENDKYLIEIMYNYAKIEVMVDKPDLNIGILNAISILNNIVYNDIIIENYLGDDILNFSEEIFDIFGNNANVNSNYSISE